MHPMSTYYFFPGMMYDEDCSDLNEAGPFRAAEVKTLMLRPGSKLRTIMTGDISYCVSGFLAKDTFRYILPFFIF